MDEKMLDIILDIYSKTIASEMEDTRFEDIPKKIKTLLERCLKNKRIKVKGNGLSKPMRLNIRRKYDKG